MFAGAPALHESVDARGWHLHDICQGLSAVGYKFRMDGEDIAPASLERRTTPPITVYWDEDNLGDTDTKRWTLELQGGRSSKKRRVEDGVCPDAAKLLSHLTEVKHEHFAMALLVQIGVVAKIAVGNLRTQILDAFMKGNCEFRITAEVLAGLPTLENGSPVPFNSWAVMHRLPHVDFDRLDDVVNLGKDDVSIFRKICEVVHVENMLDVDNRDVTEILPIVVYPAFG